MKKIFKQNFLYLGLFLIFDVIYSNIFYKKNIKYNCITHTGEFHFLEKNCSATEKYVKQTKSYKVYTDKNGYRYSGKKRNEKIDKSAIFLGDSFTYGMGLSYDKTFVGLLENDKKDFNFYNLGVAGYSPTVYLYQLREIIKNGITPSKIFLTLDISDVKDEASKWKIDGETQKPIYIFKKKIKTKKLSFKQKNFKGSRLIARNINNFFRNIRLSFLTQNNEPIIDPGKTVRGSFLYLNLEETDQSLWRPVGFNGSLNKIKNNIHEISKISKSIGAEFYILIYPWPDTLYYGTDKFGWENFAKTVCNDNNCRGVINLFPEFKKIHNEKFDWYYNLYIGNDLHISEKGQKIIADKILTQAF